ncbi:MAG TPA: FliA/WhiG family RNA polymerase sigma factor [Pseudogracilibacillus sp.]|nr:FliA/WhiG family RNA polymerase sigma factor [Pseudogracilibacillus sp.]
MTEKDSQYIDDLWMEWKKHGDSEVANQLIAHYMYIVQYHVDRIIINLPDSVERNELKSLGLIGLYDSIHKFEPERKLKFDTYATIRVRGAIIDGLRKEDWLPRTLREQTKLIEKTTETLEQELNRTPTASEIAIALDMEREEVESIINHALFSNVISVDQAIKNTESDDNMTISDTIIDEDLMEPEQELVHNELKERLVESIQKLNKNEQLVINLFYVEELSLTEIGEILELTTSRISQIHKQAIFKLKDILQ